MPHEFPFRLVERAESRGDKTVALVLSTCNGLLTRGQPWSVSLVAEALAQAILLVARPEQTDHLRLVGLDHVALRRMVTAGDRLEVEVAEVGAFGALRRYRCEALCGGALVATGEVTVAS